MLKLSIVAAVICGAAFISGCGGGTDKAVEPETSAEATSAALPGQDKSGDGVVAVRQIKGPLDGIQDQLSTSVFDPLVSTTSGTSLESLLHCADAIVTHNTLDIADSILVQLERNLPSPDARQLTDMLGSVAVNLTQLLQALAGSGDGCRRNSATLDQIGFDESPLAGTPFEALGTKLGPLLARVAANVDRHDAPKAGDQPLKLEQVAELMTHIDHAMQLGLQQVPLEARRTPIVGGVLNTVATALTDNSSLFSALLGNDAAAINESLQTQLEHTLVNALVQVLPVRAIETQAGQPDLIGLPIRISVANYGDLWAASLGTAATPAQAASLDSALASIFEPIESGLLPIVLVVLGDAMESSRSGASDSSLTPAGIPSGSLLDALGTAIGDLFAGGDAECRFAALPLLSGLCRSV